MFGAIIQLFSVKFKMFFFSVYFVFILFGEVGRAVAGRSGVGEELRREWRRAGTRLLDTSALKSVLLRVSRFDDLRVDVAEDLLDSGQVGAKWRLVSLCCLVNGKYVLMVPDSQEEDEVGQELLKELVPAAQVCHNGGDFQGIGRI